MQRIDYPDPSSLAESTRRTLDAVPLNIVRICAHASTPLFDAQGALGRAVAMPEVLQPRLREAVILRVAYLSSSEYELHHHVALGRAAGLTEQDLSGIARADYSALDPLLAAAARFTDEVVVRLTPSDQTLAGLRRLVPDQVVVNMVLTIGCYMSIARLAAVAGIEIDAGALAELPTSLDLK